MHNDDDKYEEERSWIGRLFEFPVLKAMILVVGVDDPKTFPTPWGRKLHVLIDGKFESWDIRQFRNALSCQTVRILEKEKV